MTTTPVLVITGAGSGIGRAIALSAAGRGPLVLVGRRREALQQTADLVTAAGPSRAAPLLVPTDLSDPGQVSALATALHGIPVQGLVLAAGGLGESPAGDGLAALAQGWEANWRLNVLTAVLPTAALRGQLVDGGRVVAVGSIAGVRGGGSYGSAKAALVPWARDLAAALGPRRITVNVVAPGYVQETGFFGDAMTRERRQRLIDQTLTGRAGTPEDVAAVVCHLLDERSGHITGQTIHVNGGALLAG